MKLLVDMNLSPHWIALLRDAGWQAEHWSTVGRGNEPDVEIMAYGAEQGCVVLTHDMDFGAILAATHGEKPSVIQLRMEDVTPQMAGSRVLAALRHMEQELESGALLTVDRRQVRVRMLPLTF
jgi:predicted nuclease of predicted toxin-antitoxin system